MIEEKIKEIIAEHRKRQTAIKKRLNEFKAVGRRNDPDELFTELCYCLCTPGSKAESVNKIIHSDNLDLLLTYTPKKLARFLKGNCRYHNNKAGYICCARKIKEELEHLPKDAIRAREYLEQNIKGLGMKESSHFLRNIGYKGLCILDRHIVRTLHAAGIYATDETPKTRTQYLRMEQQMITVAARIKVNIDELDLAVWAMKTGYILK